MWNINYITYFQVELNNSGLSVQTWLGDISIPARTLVLVTLGVIVLRISKKFSEKNKKRKAVKK